jgi:hypothetical protein
MERDVQQESGKRLPFGVRCILPAASTMKIEKLPIFLVTLLTLMIVAMLR